MAFPRPLISKFYGGACPQNPLVVCGAYKQIYSSAYIIKIPPYAPEKAQLFRYVEITCVSRCCFKIMIIICHLMLIVGSVDLILILRSCALSSHWCVDSSS